MREENSLKSLIGLFRMHNKILKLLKNDVKKYNLNLTEFGVLEYLYNKGSQKIQTIAEKMLITSGSTTYVVDNLEKKGYLKRNICESDKRIFYAELTEKGYDFMKEIFPKHKDKIVEIFSILSEKELETLSNLFYKFKD